MLSTSISIDKCHKYSDANMLCSHMRKLRRHERKGNRVKNELHTPAKCQLMRAHQAGSSVISFLECRAVSCKISTLVCQQPHAGVKTSFKVWKYSSWRSFASCFKAFYFKAFNTIFIVAMVRFFNPRFFHLNAVHHGSAEQTPFMQIALYKTTTTDWSPLLCQFDRWTVMLFSRALADQ